MRNPLLIFAVATVVAACSIMLCSMLQTTKFPGSGVFSFLFGLTGTVSGGTVLMMAGTWLVELFHRNPAASVKGCN